ncbi:Sof1-like domain-containing protein, partial [Blyttiomyces helicus]
QKVKTISRGEDQVRERKGDIHKVQRNLNPALHPFERAREYTRALNATKLERMFAKPFVAALAGHIDGVYCMAKSPTQLSTMYSGSADGEVRIWSLSGQKTLWTARAHKGFVRGICSVPFSENFFTVGEDKIVKMWNQDEKEPLNSYFSRNAFTGIDHHRSRPIFATSSTHIDVWDHSRCVCSAERGIRSGRGDSITVRLERAKARVARYLAGEDIEVGDPIDPDDLEGAGAPPTRRAVRPSAYAPTSPDRDWKDKRIEEHILQGRTENDILNYAYKPPKRKRAPPTASRPAEPDGGRDRWKMEMLRRASVGGIFCVKFTMDSKYVLSGSDDGNIRLWKANASERLGTATNRERNADNYAKSLKERYKHMPEIRRIDRHRKAPKAIKSATTTKRTMQDSEARKTDNLRKHSKPGSVPYEAERKKHILATEK